MTEPSSKVPPAEGEGNAEVSASVDARSAPEGPRASGAEDSDGLRDAAEGFTASASDDLAPGENVGRGRAEGDGTQGACGEGGGAGPEGSVAAEDLDGARRGSAGLWRRLGVLIARRPLTVAAVGALVCVFAGFWAAGHLKAKTARIELTGPDLPFVKRHLAIESEFGDLNRLVVAVKGDAPDCRRYADELSARVRADPKHFRDVFVRLSPADFGPHALLFVPTPQLRTLSAALERVTPSVREHGAWAGALDAMATELEERLEKGEAEDPQPGPPKGEPEANADANGEAALFDLVAQLLEDTNKVSRGVPVSKTPADQVSELDDAGYVWSADGRTLLLLVAFEEAGGALDPRSAAVRTLREHMAEIAPRHPQVEAGLTGKPVLDVDEMTTYEADSIRASVAALLGVTLLLVLGLRRLSGPLLVGGCLLLSVALTLGLASIWPGHLNLMAVVFVIVVIGLGVDFGVHLISRYDELRATGAEAEDALSLALERTGPAIAAGAATTAGAFFGALLTDFKGLREFGVVAGLGVLASMLVMLTILPGLVLRFDGERRARGNVAWLGFLDRWIHARPGAVLLAAVVLSAASVFGLTRLRYDANLLEIQDQRLESVQLELALLRDAKLTSLFLAYASDDPAEIAAVSSRVLALPGVRRVESALNVFPAESGARLPAARAARDRLRALIEPPPPPATAAGLRGALDRLSDALEDALEQAVANDLGEAIPRLERLEGAASRARAALGEGDLPSAARDYDRALREAIVARLAPHSEGALQSATPSDLPVDVRARLIGSKGSYLLRIYPRTNLWNPAELSAFLAEVRTVLPEVSGVPVLLHDSSKIMFESYQRAGWIALGVVFCCLLLLFRALGPALLAMGALLVGALWTAGLMGLVGMNLNPANLVALPLLLGVGIDTAVHVVHRAREVGPRAPLAGTSLGHALVFSGLTSAASFGSLMLADHPGSASIGSTISLGVLCCVVAGLTLPSAFMAWRADIRA